MPKANARTIICSRSSNGYILLFCIFKDQMTFIRSPIFGYVTSIHKKIIYQKVSDQNIRRICPYHVCISHLHPYTSSILGTKQSTTCRLMVELEFRASGSPLEASPRELLRARKVFFTSECYVKHFANKIL
jgi:hypothetical protein